MDLLREILRLRLENEELRNKTNGSIYSTSTSNMHPPAVTDVAAAACAIVNSRYVVDMLMIFHNWGNPGTVMRELLLMQLSSL